MDSWIAQEPYLRWYLYLLAFGVIAAWESLRPRRQLVASTPIRWSVHLCIVVLTNFLVLWIFPAGFVVAAVAARNSGPALLNQNFLPVAVQGVLGILALDFVRYLQHYLLHAVPWMWRLHQIHHADPDYDLTTGLRFHPIESTCVVATYLPVIWVLGAPPVAVMLYELVYLFETFFAHGNIVMPKRVDSLLRVFVVTPDMHRIHHSDEAAESRTNYGALFPWWDRLLRTYQAQPAATHAGMGVGLAGYQDNRSLNPLRFLLWPFWNRAMGPPRLKKPSAEERPAPSGRRAA